MPWSSRRTLTFAAGERDWRLASAASIAFPLAAGRTHRDLRCRRQCSRRCPTLTTRRDVPPTLTLPHGWQADPDHLNPPLNPRPAEHLAFRVRRPGLGR